MGQTTKKRLLGAGFFLVVFALTLWAVFHDQNPGELLQYLGNVNEWYLIPAVACVAGFILGEAVIVHALMRSLGTRVRLTRCCIYSFIGFFYSAITPSASGGQPMQVMAMRKDGIPSAVSTVVLAIVTIEYKLVLVLLGSVVMLLRPSGLMAYLEPVMGLCYLGMFLNVVFIGLLLMAVFHPASILRLSELFLTVANRLHLVKNPKKLRDSAERMIQQYQGTASFFRKHPLIMLNMFLVTLLQRLCFFGVVWMIYLACGCSGHSPILLVGLYGMISVAVDMLPLPGGMGISEKMFLIIFAPIFGEGLVLPGMVLCRGVSYYAQLLICGIAAGLNRIFGKKREKP